MSLTRLTAKGFVQALSEECKRTRKNLRLPGYPRLYYLSYLLRDTHTMQIWGRLGNINHIIDNDMRDLYCDCRVGSYGYDQTIEGGLDDNHSDTDTYEHVDMPVGNDIDALKFHVWKLTDGRYREAVRHYLRKKSQHITYIDPNRGLPSFRRMRPIQDMRFKQVRPPDTQMWRNYVIRSSRVIKDYPQVKNSWVEMRVRDITRLFVNSEGSQIIDQKRICDLACNLWLLNAEGDGIQTRITHITSDLADLPSLRAFNLEVKKRIELLDALSEAPTIKSYAGPVLLAPGPAGILFHEVLGHRLEGSRLLSTHEGQTFKRDLGKKILPEFLSLEDDPTQREICSVKTVGSYRYDDEGSRARSGVLVRDGRLVGFLSGRAPVTSKKMSGNGHARNEYSERPISRMANLIVKAKNGISHRQLKARLLEEIKSQKVPFGIMILDAEGGETATEAYDFQAFMGSVSLAVQVWADGRENLVRGVNFVGTPLSALRNVAAVGDTPVCQNAFCGAESGVVPVSTTSPALLLTNLELQASDQRKFAQYALPMPYEKAALRR